MDSCSWESNSGAILLVRHTHTHTHTERQSIFFFTDHQSHVTRLQCNFTPKINLTARIYLHAHTHYHRLKINPILNPLSTSKTLTLINSHTHTLYVSFPSLFLHLPHLSHCHVTSLSLCFILAYVWNFDQVLYFNPISVSLCVCVRCSQNNWLPVTCSMSCGDNQQHVFTPGFNVPMHTHISLHPFKNIYNTYFLCCFVLRHTHILFWLFLCLWSPAVSGLVTTERENGKV